MNKMEAVLTSVSKFASYTTAVGPDRIRSSQYKIQRLVWVMVILGSLGMCIWEIYELNSQFSSKKITTTLKISYGPKPLSYIRICNLNPLKYSKLFQLTSKMDILTAASRALKTELPLPVHGGPYQVPEYNETSVKASNIRRATDDTFARIQGNVRKLYDWYVKKLETVTDAKRLLKSQILELPELDTTELYKDLIVMCRFEGIDCDNRDDIGTGVIRNAFYGNCLILGVEKNVKTEGADGGFELIIDVGLDEYIPFVSDSVGISVALYSNKKYSRDQDGIRLSPGFSTDIVIDKVTNIKIPGSNQQCVHIDDKLSSQEGYTECHESCQAEEVANHCQCLLYPAFKLRSCVSEKDIECFQRVLSTLDAKTNCSYCKQFCEYSEFRTKTTMSRWPALSMEPVIKNMLHSTERQNISIRGSLLKLRVYFSSLTTKTFQEEYQYSFENFISDIGGQLGLWIGISVLSLGELLELVGLMILALFQNRQKMTKVQEIHLK